MNKLITIISLFLSLITSAQTVTFNPTAIPLNTDFMNADRGAHLWINRDAPFGTIDIPVNNAPQQMMDGYYRFSFSHFFSGTGSDSTLNWSFFRARMGEFTAKRMGIKFRIMANGKNIGNPPSDNFNNLVQYDGGWQNIPQFLHNLQQAEPVAANRDYLSTFGGGYASWVPNTNSPQFQRWVRKFSQQLRNYIDTAVINGHPLRFAIRIYDLGFYGCFSEQHSACLCNQISDGNIPVGARHTAAGLSEIVDAQLDAMGGNSNWKYVIPFNAFDAMWLSHTFNPIAYGQYLLDHPDSISWVNDHLGAVEGYDDDYLDLNNRMGGGYNTKLMNRWKYSPLGGEPVGWGSPADRSGITQYVTHYHLSGFGNGNLDHIAANGQDDDGWPTEANNIRQASRLAGYRLRITGGSANVGASLAINLNWINEGNAPVYFPWTVQYLIKNGATTVSTLTSNFNPRYFQPAGAPSTSSQSFAIPAIPTGTYGLYVIVKDPNNYRNPMFLANTPRQSDGSYFLGNLTLGGGTNQNPVADAGNNQSITISTATLTGSGTDADGTIVSYLWTQMPGGPNTATIVSPNSATTNLTGLIGGSYVFNLLVTDNQGAVSGDNVTITVNLNTPPVANAGPNKTITLPTTSTTMAGSATDNISVASTLWTKVGGPNTFVITTPGSLTTTITGLTTAGVYTFRLTATDGSGLTNSDDMTVTVNPGNVAPVANAGANQTIVQPTSTASLSGSLSTDDVGITEYLWTQVGGPTATIATPTTVNTNISGLTAAGFYIFRLRVQDVAGLFSTDDIQITVAAAPNTAPVANAGPNQIAQIPVTNFTVLVDGSASTDNIAVVFYSWAQVDGPAALTITAPTNVSTYLNNMVVPGTYVMRLTVTDGSGLTGTDEVTITTLAAANNAPVAVAGGNIAITLPTSSTVLDGSGSSDDNAITAYLWTLVSNPVGSSPVISTPGTVSTNITNMTVAGTYVFRLRVQDGSGLFDTDDLTITVNPAANNAPVSDAGANQTITLPTSSVTQVGSGTDDNAVTGYLWTQVSGPSTATISAPTSATTNFNNLVAGIYFFQLEVTDGALTDTDEVMITVNPAPVVPPVIGGRSGFRTNRKFLPRQ